MKVEVLHNIDGELGLDDVAALKFLCLDFVSLKKLEEVQDGRDLFMKLDDQGLLGEDLLFLKELLVTIRRLDLLRFLGTTRKDVQEELQSQRPKISSYRKMLYELSEEVTEDNLKSIKFLIDLPRNRQDSCTSLLDVLVEMEKQDLLGEDNLEELKQVLARCNPRLSTSLEKYTQGRGKGSGNFPVEETPESPTIPTIDDLPKELHFVQPELRTSDQTSVPSYENSEKGVSLDVTTGVSTLKVEEEVYRMTHRPRGYCLILNNNRFDEARLNGIRLNDRRGTDKDADALKKVFSSLHFSVELLTDLCREDLLSKMDEYSAMDHRELDAFVCCILSHGELGSVYGTDGQLVQIRSITQPFKSSRCRTLACKPKLFFIQACQGKREQPKVYLDDNHAGESHDSDAQLVPSDAQLLPMGNTIPDESDFLLAMATVENYKSFRHIKYGSIYIQELCRQLETGCANNDDILTILTRVNRMVSSGEYLKSKQMPEPRYTLTKKVILPLD